MSNYLKLINKPIEPTVGQQALVMTHGMIKSVMLSQLKATATLCSADEVDAEPIKCTVTFADLKAWGKDIALCEEPSCIGRGVI